MNLCTGNCGREGIYVNKKGNAWCSKHHVNCPVVRDKRARTISRTKLKQAKLGLNPMQDPQICKKNHSLERNKKASETLKKLGRLGLLPQQKESKYLKEKRRKNISRSLKKLVKKKKFPTQIESRKKRRDRHKKMALTLKQLGIEGKLPVQNMTSEQKRRRGKKISRTLRTRIKKGLIKPHNPYGKRYMYKSSIAGDVNLRSRWEGEIAKLLDSLKLRWQYESLKIDYWDRKRKIKAITIPDFYLPKLNLLIEVKGSDFDSEKTKDKIRGIKKAGYSILLIGKKRLKHLRDGLISFEDLVTRSDMYA